MRVFSMYAVSEMHIGKETIVLSESGLITHVDKGKGFAADFTVFLLQMLQSDQIRVSLYK